MPGRIFYKKKKGEKNKDVLYKACNCPCLRPRSESFYDLFLTDTVKASNEYQELLRKREERKKDEGRKVKKAFD